MARGSVVFDGDPRFIRWRPRSSDAKEGGRTWMCVIHVDFGEKMRRRR
jgi:hypothetical protein